MGAYAIISVYAHCLFLFVLCIHTLAMIVLGHVKQA